MSNLYKLLFHPSYQTQLSLGKETFEELQLLEYMEDHGLLKKEGGKWQFKKGEDWLSVKVAVEMEKVATEFIKFLEDSRYIGDRASNSALTLKNQKNLYQQIFQPQFLVSLSLDSLDFEELHTFMMEKNYQRQEGGQWMFRWKEDQWLTVSDTVPKQ